jgi:hypothetical protein
MPIDVKYRDKDGQVKSTTVHSVEDTGDGYVRVDREHRTIIDPHTSTKFIPKEDIVEVRNRETTVADTDFHRPLVDDIRGAIDSFNKWRHGGK